FNTPDFIKKAAIEAIENNYSKYPPVNGFLDLRQAISKKFERDNGLHYSPDEIVVSTGAKQSLVNVVLSLVGKGDEVIVFAPYWVSYKAMVDLAGAELVELYAGVEKDYKVNAQQLEAAINPKTRLVMFSSPCNPTGSVYNKEELQAIAQVIEKNPQVLVISDEIYEHINFLGKHESIGQFKNIQDRVITVNGVSKSFAMTGYRIGYLGAPKWVADAANKLQGQFTSGANAVAQMAAKAAVEATPEQVQYMKDAFEKRKNLVLNRLRDIPGFKVNDPKGAFYIFPEISEMFGRKTPQGKIIEDSADFCNYILEETYVSVVTGAAFGAPNCMRISYATSEDLLEKALDRIKMAVGKLS
ncbi:MAG: pyridoxal phosphate-dependent aminotransferase, partial [Luteibaculum sp.]